jgi:antitoxin component of RelBE/YafQ-DinJ toxin-antitoxin module
MARNAAITTRVDPAIKAAIEQLADADGRTLSQYLERVLVQHLAQKKRLPTAKPYRAPRPRKD